MAHEIINCLRAKSTLRVTGNTPVTLTLADFSANTQQETVSEVAIAQVSSTTDGIWRVYRGNDTSGELILELPNFTHFILYEFDVTFANSATSNVHITNSGSAGTLIMQFAKTATYNPILTGM
jgi:hypothetical protein